MYYILYYLCNFGKICSMSCLHAADELPNSPPSIRKGLPSTMSCVAVPCCRKTLFWADAPAVDRAVSIKNKINFFITVVSISLRHFFVCKDSKLFRSSFCFLFHKPFRRLHLCRWMLHFLLFIVHRALFPV